jgi:hypothetical protein
MKVWILQPAGFNLLCKEADLPGFRKTQIQVAASNIIQADKFLLDLIRHGEKVFRAVTQKHSGICEPDAEAVPCKKLFSEFVFQKLQCL